MSQQFDFYKNVLKNMEDGVMTLERDGKITMFNPAAAKIMGLAEDDVMGRKFAEVFLMELEGNDEFNQSILDAVYQSSLGHKSSVEFRRPDGETVFLSVTSSYFRDDSIDGRDKQGVIVVFNNVTELKKLQEAEKSLNQKLRGAYRKIEESNKSLNTALKKVQVVRITATCFVFVLFLGIGLYMWNRKPVSHRAQEKPVVVTAADREQRATHVVKPRPLSSSISLSGTLQPLEKINIITPFNGTIKEKKVRYGQAVTKGDLMFILDTAELEVTLRNAKAAYIKAVQKYRELENWPKGREMSRAKRALTKAKQSLDTARRKHEESKLLYEKGIDSANDFESARISFVNAQMDYKASQEELQSVKDKGSPENINIARMELENAEKTKQELEAKFESSQVRAPVSGVVVKPETGEKSTKKSLELGTPVQEGDVIIAVGNLAGMSVKTEVDEIDIGKIKFGQAVVVTGDAFPDFALNGSVSSISFQASSKGRGVPTFDVTVHITELLPDQKEKVRLGMTANLEVKVYDNPGALLVPIAAVHSKQGKNVVTLQDPSTQELKEVEVEPGITTITSVEINKGLKEGDIVVVGY